MLKLSSFFGLLGAIALSLPSQAQTAYIPVTSDYGCDYIDGMLCYDTLDNYDKIIYMNVTYYGEWYMLAIQQFGLHNMMYIVDKYGAIVSQQMISDQETSVPYYQGQATSDGDVYFFGSFIQEFAFLFRSRNWL